jgi:FKBP-type peptidyl-prolyl cis-trans isomerase
MNITLSKKNIIIAVIAIVVIILGSIFYLKFKTLRYEKAAKEMKINSSVNLALLSEVLEDISNAWNTGIEGGDVLNENGENTYVHDMNYAVQLRINVWKTRGMYDVIDSISKKTTEEMEIMSNSPSKYKDVQKTFLEIYNNINELISLSKTPQYSLMAFSQKVNDLLMNSNSKLKETDLQIKVDDKKIQERDLSVLEAISQKQKDLEKIKQQSEMAKWSSYIKEQKAFLVKNSKKQGVITLPSGLQYKIIKKGNGKIPTDFSMVKVNYEGRTINGLVFDSSYSRNTPITIFANQVIKGWTEALTHMPVGSVWEIYVPQELAYGKKEYGDIKPYSTLIFKIELLGIEKD